MLFLHDILYYGAQALVSSSEPCCQQSGPILFYSYTLCQLVTGRSAGKPPGKVPTCVLSSHNPRSAFLQHRFVQRPACGCLSLQWRHVWVHSTALLWRTISKNRVWRPVYQPKSAGCRQGLQRCRQTYHRYGHKPTNLTLHVYGAPSRTPFLFLKTTLSVVLQAHPLSSPPISSFFSPYPPSFIFHLSSLPPAKRLGLSPHFFLDPKQPRGRAHTAAKVCFGMGTVERTRVSSSILERGPGHAPKQML